ncbi:DUF397 domain-containing protein [Sphaerisporangium dianthi]|uniref:DUF397 domain-containing protein n=1 Tax=Sphaerisporangium dianthi TaxID=1436120 RepID=A0ABV9CID3_9ACTN
MKPSNSMACRSDFPLAIECTAGFAGIALRDSKRPHGPVSRVTAGEWAPSATA